MHFHDSLPEWYRALTHGETAATLERTGGIAELSIIDVEYKNGVPYPDQNYLRIFSRSGKSHGRPVFSSGIRPVNLNNDGAVNYFYPSDCDIHPWGCLSKDYSVMIDDYRLFLVCRSKDKDRKTLRLIINTDCLFKEPLHTLKNPRATESGYENGIVANDPVDPDYPLSNGTVSRTLYDPSFKSKALTFHQTFHFPYGDRELYFSFYGGDDVSYSSRGQFLYLDLEWNGREELAFVLAFSKEEKESIRLAKESLPLHKTLLKNKIRKDLSYAKKAAAVAINGMPEVEDFFREQNKYHHALLVGDEIGIRAASFKFAFFAMWDAIFPIRDFLRNREFAQAKKMFRYMRDFPWIDHYPWGAMHLTCLLEEILAYGNDDKLLKESYPVLQRYFAIAAKLEDPETGFISDTVNCGVDAPAEQGIIGRHYAVCINAIYYSALRVMEHFALQMGDSEEPFKTRRKKIEKHYLKAFYHPELKYLRVALDSKKNPPTLDVPMNTFTIGLEFPYGDRLFGEKLPDFAHFQKTRLKHPLGHTAIPNDCLLPCDMWLNVHMNQHLGHEGRLARLAGDPAEVKRFMLPYFNVFKQYGVAIETWNLPGCQGDESQTANWQSFSSTAAATAVISGLAGIFHHCGGYTYFPADSSDEIIMKQFDLQGKSLTVKIHGKGKYAKSNFNGKTLKGTLQLPADLKLKAENEWIICRTNAKPETPVLVNTHGLPVKNVSASRNSLAFTACRSGEYPITLLNADGLRTLINGKEVKTDQFHEIDVKIGDLVEFKK